MKKYVLHALFLFILHGIIFTPFLSNASDLDMQSSSDLDMRSTLAPEDDAVSALSTDEKTYQNTLRLAHLYVESLDSPQQAALVASNAARFPLLKDVKTMFENILSLQSLQKKYQEVRKECDSERKKVLKFEKELADERAFSKELALSREMSALEGNSSTDDKVRELEMDKMFEHEKVLELKNELAFLKKMENERLHAINAEAEGRLAALDEAQQSVAEIKRATGAFDTLFKYYEKLARVLSKHRHNRGLKSFIEHLEKLNLAQAYEEKYEILNRCLLATNNFHVSSIVPHRKKFNKIVREAKKVEAATHAMIEMINENIDNAIDAVAGLLRDGEVRAVPQARFLAQQFPRRIFKMIAFFMPSPKSFKKNIALKDAEDEE